MNENEIGAEKGAVVRRVTRGDLMRNVRRLGSDYAFNDSGPADEAVLEGQFDTLNLRPGLILHAAAVRDLCDLSSSHKLNPGLEIVVLVDGCTDLSYGHHRFELGPGSADPAGRHRGALVNLAEADQFSRRWRRGRHERKVSMTLTPEWLAQAGMDEHGAPQVLQAFMREHLASQPWTVSARARELARQILEPASYLPGMQRLRLEGRCIELAAEAIGAIGAVTSKATPVRPVDLRRLARLDELLRSEAGGRMSMAEIARELGTNASSLQVLAKRVWGVTVFGRCRTLRMELALSLLRQGAEVSQAAEAAGYVAATNFSTAFKRHFGVSPRSASEAQ